MDWRLGEHHMRRLLLDGDVAQNVGNWQWTAGTGAGRRLVTGLTNGRAIEAWQWTAGTGAGRRLVTGLTNGRAIEAWQWTAGTGADAAPYFRIFNPTRQSQRFDPAGDYIRRWVPELSDLTGREIHTPWPLGPLELAARAPGYPMPIVDHAEARDRTLAAFEAARRQWAGE